MPAAKHSMTVQKITIYFEYAAERMHLADREQILRNHFVLEYIILGSLLKKLYLSIIGNLCIL